MSVVFAQEEARALKHNYIGTEHILLGLLREESALAARALGSLGIAVDVVRDKVARIVGSGHEDTTGQIPFTPRAKKVLELALREALSLGHDYIGTEHILLGLVRENEGVAAHILLDFDADAEKIRNQVIRMLSGPGRRSGSSGGGEPMPGTGPILFTLAGQSVVALADEEARALKHDHIGTEHILLGLLREEEGLAGRLLRAVGMTSGGVRTQVARIVGEGAEAVTGDIPFTPSATKLFEFARLEALLLGHPSIGTDHIMLGLVLEKDGIGARIVREFRPDAS